MMSKTTTKENGQEVVSGIKSFKASAEVENFLRFVHENNLRNEAHNLLKIVVQKAKANEKASARKRKNTKLQ